MVLRGVLKLTHCCHSERIHGAVYCSCDVAWHISSDTGFYAAERARSVILKIHRHVILIVECDDLVWYLRCTGCARWQNEGKNSPSTVDTSCTVSLRENLDSLRVKKSHDDRIVTYFASTPHSLVLVSGLYGRPTRVKYDFAACELHW